MICELINLLEMLSSILFVFLLIKCVHVGFLVVLNFCKIEKIRKDSNNEEN